jgi:putative transposase
VDFLPVLRRSLQRNGITIDHLTYFSTAFRAWITARDRPGPLLIRRDPRDLSRVFVLDSQDDSYLEVPTRDLSRPSISLWEHRLARRRLRLRHRGEIDEAALFAAIEEMRTTERTAKHLTRSARRDRVRRSAAPGQPAAPPSAAPASTEPQTAEFTGPDVVEAAAPSPFDIIEQW